MGWKYDKRECAGCKDLFPENEPHFKFVVYRMILEGNLLEPIAHEHLMWFHLKCCDENSIQEKAKTEFTCDDCGKKIDDGESYWEIAVTKEKAVYNSIEPEWGESFKMFCEGCAQHTGLFVPALETITSVVKSEFRDKIVPMEGTYVPSKVKRCSSCGSRKA